MKSRTLIGCCPKERNVEFSNLETEYLFKSLIKFGGNLSNAKKIACFIEEPEEELVRMLNETGVEHIVVNPVDKRNPFSHKIRVLDEARKYDVDHVVMLDTDIVVGGDFSYYLDDFVRAKPEDADPIGIDSWRDLFEYFELSMPKERFATSCTPEKTISYFNTGVVIIPSKYVSTLFDSWESFIHKLCDQKDDLPEMIFKNSRFFDQIAFTLALSKTKLPYSPLTLNMNYPFSGPVNASEKPESLDPLLIHHHHCINDYGEIMHCPYDNINNKIDKINLHLKNVRSIVLQEGTKVSPIAIRNLTQVHEFKEVIRRISYLPLDSKNADLQYYLALSLHHAGINLEEALIRYDHALENGFEPFWVYFNRGSLYFTLGDIENAKKDLMMAQKIKPYDVETKRKVSLLDERIQK